MDTNTFFGIQVVFNNFLLIGATDRSKISSDQKRLFFAVSLYPLLFFANTPFKSNMIYANSAKNAWRIPLLKDLLLIRSNQNVLDEFNYDEIAEIIDDICKN